jgi:oxalate decarboxylase/phosphoglucose isomerase-like protein (cupin superfamily)
MRQPPSVVTIPPVYVHAVENTGGGDMAMVIWANQIFDPQQPDTYPAQIQPTNMLSMNGGYRYASPQADDYRRHKARDHTALLLYHGVR